MGSRTSRAVLVATIAVLGAPAACSRDRLGPTTTPTGAGGTSPAVDAGRVQPVDAVDAGDAGPADPPAPFSVRFELRNDTSAPLYFYEGCVGIDFGVSSASSGFRDQVGPTYQCGCSCEYDGCTGPVSCGPCPPPVGTPVAAGATTPLPWTAIHDTNEQKPRAGTNATFSCVRSRVLPAGSYRVAIRVFDDMASAAANTGGRVVTRDFDMPASGGVVDVPLSANALDSCDPQPDAAAPNCTGAEARDVPCSLGEPLSFAWEGGLTFSDDSSQLTPPAAYARRRVFHFEAKPDMTCATAVPRCARDSRVVTTSDVARVVNDPGVLSAYGDGTPVYGYDQRANDGAVLILRRPDGKSVAIGSACSGCAPPEVIARPLTPALSAVVPVLSTLDQQMMSTPACAAFRGY